MSGSAPPPPDDEAERKRARRRAWNVGFSENVPHNRALGLVVVDIGDGAALIRLPYDPRLVGNPETGVLHGGPITALLDACSGAAVFAALERMQPIATLDLRIDYLRPAEPGRDVTARATCYHTSKNVGFTRAVAFHDREDEPIATSTGTFMLGTTAGGGKRP
ncbi:MAG: PaaI family thioesterase [Kofleriaceae bacterium]|nr:PaaI family thioesterase [Kofleriaceae bacterium]MCL4223297.1 PaaI family thioesterase [Myxococcales bacterium]